MKTDYRCVHCGKPVQVPVDGKYVYPSPKASTPWEGAYVHLACQRKYLAQK